MCVSASQIGTKVAFKRLGSKAFLREFKSPVGLPDIDTLKQEISGYWDVLLGRVEPPVSHLRVDALLEVADTYYSRALELTSLIRAAEQDGLITKNSDYYKFRTGQLRDFIDAVKHAGDVGSRRITMRSIRNEEERLGRDIHLDM